MNTLNLHFCFVCDFCYLFLALSILVHVIIRSTQQTVTQRFRITEVTPILKTHFLALNAFLPITLHVVPFITSSAEIRSHHLSIITITINKSNKFFISITRTPINGQDKSHITYLTDGLGRISNAVLNRVQILFSTNTIAIWVVLIITLETLERINISRNNTILICELFAI